MELVKPDPRYIDGFPHYTLSSYEAPNVEIRIPYVCEEDIEYVLEHKLEQLGGDMSYLDDGDWLRQRFNGIDNEEELREMARETLVSPDGELARTQKQEQSAKVLVKRLNERIPDSVIYEKRKGLLEGVAKSLDAVDKPESILLARMEMTKEDFYQMIDEVAESNAKNEAALEAWADHFEIDVKDEDVPRVMGVNDVQAQDFMDYMGSHYDWLSVRQVARHNLVLEDLVAKCNCTYVQETPEEAHERLAWKRKIEKEEEEREACFERPNFKLV